MTSAGIIQLVRHCPLLEYLDLECTLISDEALLFIAKYCPRMRFLDVSNCAVSEAALDELRRRGDSLQLRNERGPYEIVFEEPAEDAPPAHDADAGGG